MSITLQPQANFTIVRQIANHLDTDTLYVQAVVRNAYTDQILATLNLDDKGSQRFTKNWQVPADSSGQGFYVSIITSVYSDSGYTTKSSNYGDEANTYLVQNRVQFGSGGSSIGASDIRRVLAEEVTRLVNKIDEKVASIKTDEVSEREIEADPRIEAIITDNKKMLSLLASILDKRVDLSQVYSLLGLVRNDIAQKPVTPAPDFEEVLSTIGQLPDKEMTDGEIKRFIRQITPELEAIISPIVEQAVAEATPKALGNATFNIPMQLSGNQTKQESNEPKMDLSKLAI